LNGLEYSLGVKSMHNKADASNLRPLSA
jgi:hypothetical protein